MTNSTNKTRKCRAILRISLWSPRISLLRFETCRKPMEKAIGSASVKLMLRCQSDQQMQWNSLPGIVSPWSSWCTCLCDLPIVYTSIWSTWPVWSFWTAIYRSISNCPSDQFLQILQPTNPQSAALLHCSSHMNQSLWPARQSWVSLIIIVNLDAGAI